jgi:bacterial/archaeal transporter family-2 protein
MIWIAFALMFAAGGVIAIQAGVNSQLARALGSPLLASTVSFLVGSAALALCSLGIRRAWPPAAALAGLPWWAWTGGLLGACFVLAATTFATRLGAATLLSVAVAGQMTVALVLDRFGLVGFEARPLSAWRVAGAGLVVAGTVLIRQC